MLCRKSKIAGFTLVEMAIVLVVIGFIIGGIFTGTSLINASKRQAVITDIETYRTQVEIFEDQYAGLPGDLFNAEEHWPDASFSTDNGDGDGSIESASAEDFLTWEHLYLANLIPFAYTGTGPNYTLNSNIPESSYQNKGFRILSTSGLAIYEVGTTTRLRIDLAEPNGAAFDRAALIPKDAEKIDIKIDDGYPTTGNVMAMDASNKVNDCVNTSPTPNLYMGRSKEEECIMFFLLRKKQ